MASSSSAPGDDSAVAVETEQGAVGKVFIKIIVFIIIFVITIIVIIIIVPIIEQVGLLECLVLKLTTV